MVLIRNSSSLEFLVRKEKNPAFTSLIEIINISIKTIKKALFLKSRRIKDIIAQSLYLTGSGSCLYSFISLNLGGKWGLYSKIPLF
jgi:hypothetical protein